MLRKLAPRRLLSGIGGVLLLALVVLRGCEAQSYLQRQREREKARRGMSGPEVPRNRQNAEEWYPHFPRCADTHPQLKFPGGVSREKCVRLPLHPLAKKATETGPGPQPKTSVDYKKFPSYVFMLGTPYGGTTSLLGMLSSSPNVTVPNGGWAHEAHWQLAKEKVFPFLKRSGMHYMKAREIWGGLRDDPNVNLQEMEEAWDPIWDKTKSIRVDKSHHLIHLAPQIYTHFRAKGSAVKFIILLRHPCTYSREKMTQRKWLREAQGFKRVLEEYPDDSILVQFEDFVENPHAIADKLVRFVPQFGSMDPSKSNLLTVYTTLNSNASNAGDRGQAIGGADSSNLREKYVDSRMRKKGGLPPLQRGWCEGFPSSRKEISNEEGLDILRFFGYLAPIEGLSTSRGGGDLKATSRGDGDL